MDEEANDRYNEEISKIEIRLGLSVNRELSRIEYTGTRPMNKSIEEEIFDATEELRKVIARMSDTSLLRVMNDNPYEGDWHYVWIRVVREELNKRMEEIVLKGE